MQKLILSILVVFSTCASVWSAELLILAKDTIPESGYKIGDIIVVRPDGWSWGKEECLPNYVVIKMPGVHVDDVKHYEDPLVELKEESIDSKIVRESVVVRARKYTIPREEIISMKSADVDVKNVATKEIGAFKNSIVEKDLSEEKDLIAEVADAEAVK